VGFISAITSCSPWGQDETLGGGVFDRTGIKNSKEIEILLNE